MAKVKNYYEILGVNTFAAGSVINKAYSKLAKEGKDTGEVSQAWDTLTDPTKKEKYDNLPIVVNGKQTSINQERIDLKISEQYQNHPGVEKAASSLRKVRSTSGDSLGSTESEGSTISNSSVSSFESILSSNDGKEIRSTLRKHEVAHVAALKTEEPVVVTSVRDRANALNKIGSKPVINR